jgi:hypothetical protein
VAGKRGRKKRIERMAKKEESENAFRDAERNDDFVSGFENRRSQAGRVRLRGGMRRGPGR